MQKVLDTILRDVPLRSPCSRKRDDWSRQMAHDATQRAVEVTAQPRASDHRRPILVAAEMPMVYRCMTHSPSFAELSDRDLIAEVQRLAGSERAATAAMVACLAEMDTRRLYLGEGCRSLFAYCTQVLHLSEHAAYARIEAARAVRRFPVILERLSGGEVTLTAIGLLRPHLTEANHLEILDCARFKLKRDVEELVASLAPQPDAPAMVRKLPERPMPQPTVMTAESSTVTLEVSAPVAPAAPAPLDSAQPATVVPLAPERYRMQFTVGRATRDKFRRAQDLLRHSVPNGDPAAIFDRALTILVEKLERAKFAAASRPRRASSTPIRSRHIPAAVKRAVAQRDAGQCAFVGAAGRCVERGALEFHHLVPYAEGGKATAENIQLRCRAHNQYEAEQWFGPLMVRELGPGPSSQWHGIRASALRSNEDFL
jgi:5-methylcytosine-specific restriction endonuclease McrA